MESRFAKCSCGSRQAIHKMQSAGGELVCRKCAKIAEVEQKRKLRKADDYQVIVILLDGTRLFYQPIGG